MRTCAVVWPFFTSTILPLRMLRALSFMGPPECWRCVESVLAARLCAVEQLVELGPAQIDLIELAIKVACDVADMAGEPIGEQQSRHPLQPDQPVERGWGVDPAVGELRAEEHPAAPHGIDL